MAAEAIIATVAVGGSPILPVSQQLIDTIQISNRIVSFVLDGQIHFGTGILVGPRHVLTAAHLFFEKNGRLIDRRRLGRITVETHTTFLGKHIEEGPRRTVHLCCIRDDQWLLDPQLTGDRANRDVDFLDFAIVVLCESLGDEPVGEQRRGWFEIPTAATAPVLCSDLGVRAFQFLDREELLVSAGAVADITTDGMRVLYTASTAPAASGAAIVDAEARLIALHVNGAATGERRKLNRGLPIRRVAEIIDAPRATADTVRRHLQASCARTEDCS